MKMKTFQFFFEHGIKKSPPLPYEEELAREKERLSKKMLSCRKSGHRLRYQIL